VADRFTPSQVALARRICEAEWNKLFNHICRYDPPEETHEQWAKRILDAPIHPPEGPEPPWWKQAIEWADRGRIWVKGYGYMREELWQDILEWTRTNNS